MASSTSKAKTAKAARPAARPAPARKTAAPAAAPRTPARKAATKSPSAKTPVRKEAARKMAAKTPARKATARPASAPTTRALRKADAVADRDAALERIRELQPAHGHVVAIRRGGQTVAYQCRFDGGGPGRSLFFSASQHGGPEKAQKAAMKALKSLGLKPGKRGGSPVGRITRRSATQAAGIRFVWTSTRAEPVLRVIATWVDRDGSNRHTSYSVDRHGLRGALERAVEARTSAGAPAPAFEPLLKRLREKQRQGPGA